MVIVVVMQAMMRTIMIMFLVRMKTASGIPIPVMFVA